MSGGGNIDPLSLIKRFSDEEKSLSSELFLAPYVPGAKIKVKVQSIVYELEVVDAGPLSRQGGFGLFQITRPGKVRLVEVASRNQVDAYLKMLPRITLVLIGEFDHHWWGVQANPSDSRFKLAEPVPILLAERVTAMEQVYARFDGSSFWYQAANRRRDPLIARHLREAMDTAVAPTKVRVSGAAPSELLAYRIVYADRFPNQNIQRPRTDLERLRDALTHAGARLDAYWAQGNDVMRVRYVIDGHTHSADVRINDLTVVSAGVCLSGRDRDFDLTSLVGVMRELHDRGGADHDDEYD